MEEPVSQVPWFKPANAGEQILMFISLSVIRTSIVSKKIYKDTASPSQESAGVFECTTSQISIYYWLEVPPWVFTMWIFAL